MRVFDAVHKALGVIIVGLVVVIFVMVTLHSMRGRQYREEMARRDALSKMAADGFFDVEILAQKQFTETRTCRDFKISFIGSGGQPMWGHFLDCEPFRSEGQGATDYIVKDFCEEGAINCSPDWRERDYDDCAEESDCE